VDGLSATLYENSIVMVTADRSEKPCTAKSCHRFVARTDDIVFLRDITVVDATLHRSNFCNLQDEPQALRNQNTL
jgi:hypothetical protein